MTVPQPSLVLDKQVAITQTTSAVATAATSPSPFNLAFALSLSILLSSAFLIHIQSGSTKGPLGFFSIIPLTLTSPARAFERLANKTKTGYTSSYSKYKKLHTLSRLSLVGTILTGTLKLLALIAFSATFIASQSSIHAQNPNFTAGGSTVFPQDTLTYKLTLQNSGGATATNLLLTDSIPQGTAYIPNSLIINNLPS
ncbi:MAG: Conserved repeat domain protein, partial [Parcubacteria group bacterium GW2011_GWA2_47_26]